MASIINKFDFPGLQSDVKGHLLSFLSFKELKELGNRTDLKEIAQSALAFIYDTVASKIHNRFEKGFYADNKVSHLRKTPLFQKLFPQLVKPIYAFNEDALENIAKQTDEEKAFYAKAILQLYSANIGHNRGKNLSLKNKKIDSDWRIEELLPKQNALLYYAESTLEKNNSKEALDLLGMPLAEDEKTNSDNEEKTTSSLHEMARKGALGPNLSKKQEEEILMISAKEDYPETIKKIFSGRGYHYNRFYQSLNEASAYGNMRTVKALLEISREKGFSLSLHAKHLINAATFGSKETVEVILQSPFKTRSYHYALKPACTNGHYEVTKLLLTVTDQDSQEKLSSKLKHKQIEEILQSVTRNGYKIILKLLLEDENILQKLSKLDLYNLFQIAKERKYSDIAELIKATGKKNPHMPLYKSQEPEGFLA